MLEAGEVYAVQEGQMFVRSAKLTLQEDMICLHHLQERHPPALARTIPVWPCWVSVFILFDMFFLIAYDRRVIEIV